MDAGVSGEERGGGIRQGCELEIELAPCINLCFHTVAEPAAN